MIEKRLGFANSPLLPQTDNGVLARGEERLTGKTDPLINEIMTQFYERSP